MLTPQETGIALVAVGFCAWTIAWMGLLSYGLAWLVRDRTGGVVSILCAVFIFAAGMYALTQTPGVPQ